MFFFLTLSNNLAFFVIFERMIAIFFSWKDVRSFLLKVIMPAFFAAKKCYKQQMSHSIFTFSSLFLLSPNHLCINISGDNHDF